MLLQRVCFCYSPHIKNSAHFAFERVAVVDEPLAKPEKRVPAMEEQLAKKGKHVDEDDGGMIYRRGGSLWRKFRDNEEQQ